MGNACSCRVCSKTPVLFAQCLGMGILEGTENLSSCENLCALKSSSEVQRVRHEQKS